jgi:hypothetical protein
LLYFSLRCCLGPPKRTPLRSVIHSAARTRRLRLSVRRHTSWMELPPKVRRLAEAQLGVFARRQFPPDLPSHRVDDLLRSPRVERLHRGVYTVVGGAVHRHRSAMAAALRVGPGAVLSGPAALELTGPEGLTLSSAHVVIVPAGWRGRARGIPTASPGRSTRRVRRFGAVRVASPVDALLDSLRYVELPDARRLRLSHDQLRWAGILRTGQLAERAEQLGHLRALAGHELLGLDAAVACGDGERRLGALLACFRPAPEAQAWVTPDRCVDWYFRAVKLGVEYQGSVDHGYRSGRARDTARDRELRRVGIHLVYVTARDLGDERALIATIAGALASRAHQLGVAAPAVGDVRSAG